MITIGQARSYRAALPVANEAEAKLDAEICLCLEEGTKVAGISSIGPLSQ